MEELLELNDRLTSLIKDLVSHPPFKPSASSSSAKKISSLPISIIVSPQKTGIAPYSSVRPSVMRRNSKGKEPALEHPDINPNASFAIGDSDDEDPISHKPHQASVIASGDGNASGDLEPAEQSPTVRSKVWVEEEGEVFRKGNALLGPNELDEGGVDISSEELKREVSQTAFYVPDTHCPNSYWRRKSNVLVVWMTLILSRLTHFHNFYLLLLAGTFVNVSLSLYYIPIMP